MHLLGRDTRGNEGKQNDGEKSKFHVKFIKITNNKNVVEMQQIMVFRLRFLNEDWWFRGYSIKQMDVDSAGNLWTVELYVSFNHILRKIMQHRIRFYFLGYNRKPIMKAPLDFRRLDQSKRMYKTLLSSQIGCPYVRDDDDFEDVKNRFNGRK